MTTVLFSVRYPDRSTREVLHVSLLTARYDRAFEFASALHRDDVRKGGAIPYLTHLMSVSALVLEDSGTQDEAIAGLLHDAVEDHGQEQLPVIQERFGPRVAAIVQACSDSIQPAGAEKPDWRCRKTEYIAHVGSTSDLGYLRVTLADKLHNARCIVSDLHAIGDAVFERFNKDSDQIWYYRSLAAAFCSQRARGLTSPMLDELDRVVTEMERLAPGAAEP